MKKFNRDSYRLRHQFDDIAWDSESGLDEGALICKFEELMKNRDNLPKPILKAMTFRMICRESRIAIDEDDIFQDKLFGGRLMLTQRNRWQQETVAAFLAEEDAANDEAWTAFGAYRGHADFGHISPNTALLVREGFAGILKRIEEAAGRPGLTEKQQIFYESCRIMYQAMIDFTMRLARAVKPYSAENSEALAHIAVGAPENMYEAMQLLILYFFLHEYIAGARVRTLGRLDVLLSPFYENDLKNGTFTKAEIREMMYFFLNKFWSAGVPYDLPFCLGGTDRAGQEVTCALSYLIIEAYNALDIHSPKIHIRVSDKTPPDFVKQVLSFIRAGNSSFVFISDAVGIKSLERVGIEKEDARDFVPIGCYEPAVWGMEIGCTGNSDVNLAKAVEFALTGGADGRTGKQISLKTGPIESYGDFLNAVKKHIRFMAEKAMEYVREIEKYYIDIYPDPILSAMYEESLRRGVDVYEGGAKYNNSSVMFMGIATCADAIMAVKKLVFEDGDVTMAELCRILQANWAVAERLRHKALKACEKFGNNKDDVDEIAADIAHYAACITNGQPNNRGGVFKAAMFTVDYYVYLGERTMATPDGRLCGDILSKNLCATVAMDKKGITALIHSVTKMDHAEFPDGSVLDILLHPSAVQGEDGLDAFYGILMTYLQRGGFAMHGNIFNPEDLKAAQKKPEKYKNLQVRVCGWNAYFVNLSREEQDAFIRQAENNC